MDYEEDMLIDESALDVELLNQPSLAMEYGREWARCQRELHNAIEAVKLIRSELIFKANTKPEKYLGKGVKPTGPIVEAFYRQHEDHIEAKEALAEAQYEANIAEIAKKEVSITRRNSLEQLITLHGQNYFAGPSVPRDLSIESAKKERTKRVNVSVGNRLKRKK